MKIKRKSAKDKGKRLQKWIAKKISEITGLKCGKDELIESRPGCLSGIDIMLYGEAKEKFPFSVEAKYQETWSIPSWIKQAKQNQIKGTDWLLVVKKNRHEEIVIMDAAAFFDIYEQYIRFVFGDSK